MQGSLLFEISPRALRGDPCPFDIYVPGEGEEGMRLVYRKNSGFDEETKAELVRQAGHCYIARVDIRHYIEYIFERIEEIVEDASIPADQIAKVLYLIAKRSITRAYMNPGEYRFFTDAAKLVNWLVRAHMYDSDIARQIFLYSADEEYGVSHPLNVALLNLLVGHSIYGRKPQTLKRLVYVGLMHDIGKSALDQAANNSGPVTDVKLKLMKEHASYSYEILMNHSIEKEICLACKHHHERMDGSGYPDGLRGKEIPVWSRITAVNNVFDTFTTDTTFKEAVSHLEALAQMLYLLEVLDHEVFDHLVKVVLRNKVLVRLFQRGQAGEVGARLATYIKNRAIDLDTF